MTDAIVIGAGHNGLVCATLLARAGHSVLLLEAAEEVGGMARGLAFGDGYRAPTAPFAYPLDPDLCRQLDLAAHGYQAGTPVATVALAADGRHLTLHEDRLEGVDIPAEDRAAWPAFRQQADDFLEALAPLFGRPPPRLKDFSSADRNTLMKLAWKIRFGLGRERMYEFLRLLAMNIYDVLDDGFTDPRLKGALAADAVLGCQMGPRTPGTVMSWLQRRFPARHGALSAVRTGAGNLSDALLAAAQAAGVQVRQGQPVQQISVDRSQVTGVVLADGETLSSGRVISALDPRATFGCLVGAPALDAQFAQRARQIRGEGVVAQLHLGLRERPAFAGLDADQHGQRLLFAPDARYVERSFNGSKYGEAAAEPVLEIALPSVHETELAPAGHHVMSVNVSAMPYSLKGGWDAHKAALQEQLLDQLEGLAPGLREQVVVAEFLSPVDIEARTGAVRGHWHHGELTLHQSFMMRPLYGAAQYQTPVAGLYLCSAGAHPGGGVHGLPGKLAAQRVLATGGAA